MEWTDCSRKIVIAGTGRCGTTFLVQLLTLLGLPTGIEHKNGQWLMTHFQQATMDRNGMATFVNRQAPPRWTPVGGMIPDVRAGLEYHVSYADNVESLSTLPKIIKNPRLSFMLGRLLRESRIDLDYVLACVRDLREVAASKMESGKKHAQERYYHKSRRDVRKDSAAQLGEMAASLVLHEVPHTFIAFPRMVYDPEYLFVQLQPVLRCQIEPKDFHEAHAELARKDFVHHRGGPN